MFFVHNGLTTKKVIIREWGHTGNWMLAAQPGTPGAGEKQ